MAVLPTPPPGQAEFGVGTPFPVNDQDKVPGFGIHIDHHLMDQRPDNAFFHPHIGVGGMPERFQIGR